MADTDGQAGIWLVVPPKVGLPLLLGTVTLIAVLVHASLIGHTKWFPKYWDGAAAKTASIETSVVR
ncbi:antenna complex alpha/beta subunit [Rhodomicrobium vannielii ATCC 17100]|jgi:light-harvesting protein B-800-850 alpha chain|uniref:Antenna complex alpha/beta subunit n=2 Tax=Rhodomicrobium TaxID=1068 RepID=E3I3Y7_RHOVT|nr:MULTISPECIES: light-harvesting protein [Rhodomicrobium]ADP71550.1 antenna complex alpha/beta subunit [Rhodomicrobium vannielii ATCC 17100]KAI93784.1 light-harvesting protein B:800-850 subunit alpha [Rhodomicrobium udaipurense JA643]MBJ7533907.1 light-harvesting protein [Rhodomicrobium vannielii ATCC 17100]MBJ7542209.1 light-harvesting protein [Rhodomicrobium udaipurense]